MPSLTPPWTSRSLAVSPEPADDVEQGLLSAAQDVDDVPLLLSRSPSPALAPGSGSPAPPKRPPSSLGSGSDLSIELTMPLPADSRSSRCARLPAAYPCSTSRRHESLNQSMWPFQHSPLLMASSHTIRRQ